MKVNSNTPIRKLFICWSHVEAGVGVVERWWMLVLLLLVVWRQLVVSIASGVVDCSEWTLVEAFERDPCSSASTIPVVRRRSSSSLQLPQRSSWALLKRKGEGFVNRVSHSVFTQHEQTFLNSEVDDRWQQLRALVVLHRCWIVLILFDVESDDRRLQEWIGS